MSFKEEIKKLNEARKVLKQHTNQRPVTPKKGGFYRTLNDSIVYIAEIDQDDTSAKAVILKGGFQNEEVGDNYWLDKKGKYLYGDTTQMVMSLKERLALRLPE